jgi:hypothetical protein
MKSSRPIVSAVLFSACLWALTALNTGEAFATQVSCGQAITQDTTVDNDLIDCPGDGLVINADDTTLDLGGHTIDGVGQASGIAVGEGAFSTGPDRVTIENGTIREVVRSASDTPEWTTAESLL